MGVHIHLPDFSKKKIKIIPSENILLHTISRLESNFFRDNTYYVVSFHKLQI